MDAPGAHGDRTGDGSAGECALDPAATLARASGALRRRAAHLLWMTNLALAVVFASPLLDYAPLGGGGRSWIFASLALVSTLASWSAPIGLACLLLAGLTTARLPRLALQGLAWTFFQFVLFADVQIYGHFRYHLNGMVWNVLTTSGGDDAVHLKTAELVGVGAALVVLWMLQVAWGLRLERRDARRRRAERTPRAWTRARRIWWAFLVPILVVEKGLFAWADLVRDRGVTAVARVLPYYQPLTIKALAEDWFGYDLDERPSVAIGGEGLLLDYPKAPLVLPADGPRPNILMVVVDGWRQDCLREDVTPNLSRFSADARVFDDHLAGGNATRFGIFTLLYGLHGNYWDPVYLEQRPPVLVDALLDAGYDASVYSGASMNYPEFRSTAWVRMEEHVHDTFDVPEPWRKDDAAVEGLLRRLDERGTQLERPPFFSFLLFDGSHQPYSFPDSAARYEPYAKGIDYVELSGTERRLAKKERRWNGYRNSLWHIDAQLERVFEKLRAIGEFDDTIILVTGDHGEEFFDHGFFGHTSNFAPAQSLVSFVLRGPGIEPGRESRATSHVDVVTTLLELLGADGARRADWTSGANLLDPPDWRPRVMSGWETLGLWTKSGIFYLPSHAAFGGAELYDYDWKLVLDDSEAFRREAGHLSALMSECRRFLK